jgi:two-component system OmpR family sensor kinase
VTSPSRLRDARSAIAARTARISLRARLVAVLVALLLVTSAVVAIVSLLLLHNFLQDRLDQQLVQAGQRYAISLEHPSSDRDPDDAAFSSVVGQPEGTLGARAADGVVTAAGVVGRPGSLSDGARSVIASFRVSTKPRSVDLPVLGEYRVLVTAGRDGDLLVTGLPEHAVDETITQLATIETTVFGIAVVVAAITGAVSVRLSLRPLHRVTGTALRVSALPLGTGEVSMPERVPTSAPGTEVGQVAEAFNSMLEHVEKSLSQRHTSEDRLRHFAADASHELRTPVAVIRSHAEFVLRTAPDLPDDVRQAVERIHAESDRMGRLVDDLLLLARLDAQPGIERSDVDLTRLALDAVGDLRRTAAEHRWQLDLPPEPVQVRGDAHALHQAVANLLGNARTHTPPGTIVTVTVRIPDTAGIVELSVRDDGPGIPGIVLPHVFERFRRGDHSRGPDTSNAGLGLSIVEAIVRAHDGTITVQSEPGRTEFTVHLPAA